MMQHIERAQLGPVLQQLLKLAGKQEDVESCQVIGETFARLLLTPIWETLTSLDPNGDDRDYDRTNAVESVLQAMGPLLADKYQCGVCQRVYKAYEVDLDDIPFATCGHKKTGLVLLSGQ